MKENYYIYGIFPYEIREEIVNGIINKLFSECAIYRIWMNQKLTINKGDSYG